MYRRCTWLLQSTLTLKLNNKDPLPFLNSDQIELLKSRNQVHLYTESTPKRRQIHTSTKQSALLLFYYIGDTLVQNITSSQTKSKLKVH